MNNKIIRTSQRGINKGYFPENKWECIVESQKHMNDRAHGGSSPGEEDI